MEGAGDRAEGFDSLGRATEVIGAPPESNLPTVEFMDPGGERWKLTGLKAGEIRGAPNLEEGEQDRHRKHFRGRISRFWKNKDYREFFI